MTTRSLAEALNALLAFLAEEMIRLNQDKQAEIKRLPGWLEKKVRLQDGIDQKRTKTSQEVNLGQSLLAGELKKEYEAFLAKLLPLKERLALTDKLIDQVVYKLYGLTEEEVAIVEGRGK
ncbi:hypothetical protein L0337_41600 [candidate division KSB1 bacterium]|nr:hypothetical protein [candidate division KSB1 bacterium]